MTTDEVVELARRAVEAHGPGPVAMLLRSALAFLPAEVLCDKCGRRMRKRGQRTPGGVLRRYYRCFGCGHRRCLTGEAPPAATK